MARNQDLCTLLLFSKWFSKSEKIEKKLNDNSEIIIINTLDDHFSSVTHIYLAAQILGWCDWPYHYIPSNINSIS